MDAVKILGKDVATTPGFALMAALAVGSYAAYRLGRPIVAGVIAGVLGSYIGLLVANAKYGVVVSREEVE